jgi:hypothetical protein
MRDSRHTLKQRMKGYALVRPTIVLGLLGVVSSVLVGAGAAAASTGVPYVDNRVAGSIGLCDEKGQPLTHGSVDTKPFVWKAVDATAAPAPYNGNGATATLYAYQPRQGVDPGEWSGEQLSASSRFSDPAHPAAALTGLDDSLSAFLGDFPPQWNGLVELRIYLGAPNEPPYSQTYDAANIAINGSNWKLVGGSPVSCDSGSAVSLEQVLATSSAVAASLAAQTTKAPNASTPSRRAGTPLATGGPTAATASSSGQGVPAVGAVASDGSESGSTAPQSDVSRPASKGSGGVDTVLVLLIGIGILGAGFIGLQWVRSRA